MSVIQRIKELESNGKVLATLYENAEGNLECTPLQELLPQLIQEHEALLRFVERVRGIKLDSVPTVIDGACLNEVENAVLKTNRSWRTQRNDALTQLDKELKG